MRRRWWHLFGFKGYGEYDGDEYGHYEKNHGSVSISGLDLTDSTMGVLPRVTLAECDDKRSCRVHLPVMRGSRGQTEITDIDSL